MAMLQLAAWSFVMRLGSAFMLEGYPFYANGWNSYWLMIEASEESTRPRVDHILRDGAALGLTVCRTWAFNDDTYRALQFSPGNYDEAVFQVFGNCPFSFFVESSFWVSHHVTPMAQIGSGGSCVDELAPDDTLVFVPYVGSNQGLDYAIYQAQQNGVRLLLTLVNNWEDYGGKAKYVAWAKAEGENVENEDDFFTNAKCRQYYKNHVKAVLTRVNTITKLEYRDDPSIFGWELINEPRCPSDPSGATLQAWVGEMALFVKSVDNKHLLTVGTEGFYTSDSEGCSDSNPSSYFGTLGTDFIGDHDLPGIDFATTHAYPDAWLSPEANVDEKLEFFDNWVKGHKEDAEKILRMPMLVTEFGFSELKPGFSEDKREEFYSIVYDQVYATAQTKQGAAAGALQWQLLPPDMSDWNDGFGIDPACGSSLCNMITLQSERLKALYLPVCGIHSMFQQVLGNMTSPHRHDISNLFQNDLNPILK